MSKSCDNAEQNLVQKWSVEPYIMMPPLNLNKSNHMYMEFQATSPVLMCVPVLSTTTLEGNASQGLTVLVDLQHQSTVTQGTTVMSLRWQHRKVGHG